MSKAFFHRGLAIEFDDHVPRLTVDGDPLPLPADIENATPAERASADINVLLERAKRHIDETACLSPRDPIRDEHVRELKRGSAHWNDWRRRNSYVRPLLYDAQLGGLDLSSANLANANLIGAHLEHATLVGINFHEANLAKANLSHAILRNANFCRTDLYETILFHADLEGANLQGTQLARSDFRGANLVGCRIYGFSAWDLILDEKTVQKELVIVHGMDFEPNATTSQASELVRVVVDDLRVAQFVYLMLHNENLRSVLDVMTRRAVLILGRFTEGRKKVLDSIREALRTHKDGYIPMIFDFEKLPQRGLAETIRVLAGLCRFVLADITEPRSVPHELATIIASYMIPIVPLLQQGHTGYAVLDDERPGKPWILYEVVYTPDEAFFRGLDSMVIAPALAAESQILAERAAHLRRRQFSVPADL